MLKTKTLKKTYAMFYVSCEGDHPDLYVYIPHGSYPAPFMPRTGTCIACGNSASVKKMGDFALTLTDMTDYDDGYGSHSFSRRNNYLMTTILYRLLCGHKEHPLIQPLSARWKDEPNITACPICGSGDYKIEKFDAKVKTTPIEV